MSLKDKVLMGLCKEVIKKTKESGTRDFLNEILRGKKYDYRAKQQNCQFYSILGLNKRIDEFTAEGLVVDFSKLTKEEVSRLELLHNDLVNLNIDCINKIFGKAKDELTNCLVPYSVYDIQFPKGKKQYHIINEKTALDVAKKFSETSVARLLKKNISLLALVKDKHQIMGTMQLFNKEIHDAGFASAPAFTNEFLGPFQLNERHYQILFLFGLLVVQKQLGIINQLVYQACLSDKLEVFDENNIFHVDSQSSNLLSNNLSISSEINFNTNITDIVFVSLTNEGYNLNSIYFVNGTQLIMNQETGSQLDLKLIQLNDDLNPYGNLYRRS